MQIENLGAFFVGRKVVDRQLKSAPQTQMICKNLDTGNYYLGSCLLNPDIIITSYEHAKLIIKSFDEHNVHDLKIYKINLTIED